MLNLNGVKFKKKITINCNIKKPLFFFWDVFYFKFIFQFSSNINKRYKKTFIRKIEKNAFMTFLRIIFDNL